MYIILLLFISVESRILENFGNFESENLKIFEPEQSGRSGPSGELRRTKRFSSRFLSNQLGMDQWATHDSYRLIRSDMFQNKRKNFNKTMKIRIPTEDLLAAKIKQKLIKNFTSKRLLKNKRNISGRKIPVKRPSRM